MQAAKIFEELADSSGVNCVMKLTDYIAFFLRSKGVTHAFGMSGGAAVHLFDSINSRGDMYVISMTHEQCAAMAADGYARATGRLGVAVTTSGPGATNLLTGTCCSFYDSIPVLMLTGQVATHRLKGTRSVRQVGFQETDVVSIFSPITKYAFQVLDPESIRYHLEKAVHLAFEGRPGPVLLDIPDDIQRCEVDPEKLEGFVEYTPTPSLTLLTREIQGLLDDLGSVSRPVLILGAGLKTTPLGSTLNSCIQQLAIPVLASWAATDLIPAEEPLRIGTFGVYGPRLGNFAVQNADYILALGTRLSQNLTGGVLSSFAREAAICLVDVDPHELTKFEGRGITIDRKIQSRLSTFLQILESELPLVVLPDYKEWKSSISHWREVFPPERSLRGETPGSVDAYSVVRAISEVLSEEETIFVDTGGNLTWTCNGLQPKRGQRLHSAWNNTPMGYSLPAAIGAAFANPKTPITCIIGDGGLMVCLAELATVVTHQLPIRIVLFNNHGHGIQKQTLETWLNGKYVCVDVPSGLSFPPDFSKVAASFGLETISVTSDDNLGEAFTRAFNINGPVFINVEINPEQRLYPVLKHGSSLEDQMPKLDSKLIGNEMIVEPFRPTSGSSDQKKQSSEGW